MIGSRSARLLGEQSPAVEFDRGQTDSQTTRGRSFALQTRGCQDLARVLSPQARSIGIPARYRVFDFHRVDGVIAQEAGHGWAEAFVNDLGWVGFDPANGICATDAHVRVAIGLDYLGAAPVRGNRYRGGAEALEVAVHHRPECRPISSLSDLRGELEAVRRSCQRPGPAKLLHPAKPPAKAKVAS